jgi:rfaE bifunctional protein nucleotidyltransferase chain/domain
VAVTVEFHRRDLLFLRYMEHTETKILSREQLAHKVAELRNAGKRIAATNGCFDLLHIGHVRFLQAARQLGDVLIVGINSDESVRSLKGAGRPLVTADERAEVIAALSAVDYVSIFPETTAGEFLRAANPHVYAKGGDYQITEVPEVPFVEASGAQVKIIPLTENHSTTDLVAKIVANQKSASGSV